MLTTSEILLLILVGIATVIVLCINIIMGIRAWMGNWRQWAASQATTPIPRFGKYSYAGLFGFYLIPPLVAQIIFVIISTWTTPRDYSNMIALIMTPLCIPLMLIPFRLPRFLLPKWHNEWMDRGARIEEVDTPEYSSALPWPKKTPRKSARG